MRNGGIKYYEIGDVDSKRKRKKFTKKNIKDYMEKNKVN